MGSAVDKRRKIYSLDSAAVSKGIAADVFLEVFCSSLFISIASESSDSSSSSSSSSNFKIVISGFI